MNTNPATALFTCFQAACDHIDQHTTPANAGQLLIEETPASEYRITAFTPPLDTTPTTGQ